MRISISRPGGRRRSEDTFPDSIFSPTTLLSNLLDWLDRGKRWGEIGSIEVRRDVVRDLRALADTIEADIDPTVSRAPSAERLRHTPDGWLYTGSDGSTWLLGGAPQASDQHERNDVSCDGITAGQGGIDSEHDRH